MARCIIGILTEKIYIYIYDTYIYIYISWILISSNIASDMFTSVYQCLPPIWYVFQCVYTIFWLMFTRWGPKVSYLLRKRAAISGLCSLVCAQSFPKKPILWKFDAHLLQHGFGLHSNIPLPAADCGTRAGTRQQCHRGDYSLLDCTAFHLHRQVLSCLPSIGQPRR